MSAKRIKIVAVLSVCALIMGYFLYMVITQELRFNNLSTQNAALEQELSGLQLKQAALQSDLANAQSDAYMERVAREELGLVKEGEIKFVKDKRGQAEPEETATPDSGDTGTAEPEQTQEPGE